MSETRLGRRAFLSVLGLGAVGLFAGSRLSGAAAPLGNLVPNDLSNLVTSGGGRIYAISPPWPAFDPAKWTLEVTGEVENPLRLTYDDLLALGSERQTTDFHCVTGGASAACAGRACALPRSGSGRARRAPPALP